MAFLQGRVLLEGERVDLAQQGKLTLRFLRPLGLRRAVVRRAIPRFGIVASRIRRYALRGSVRADQLVGPDAVVSQCAFLQRLDPQPLLSARHLVAVRVVPQAVRLLAKGPQRVALCLECASESGALLCGT